MISDEDIYNLLKLKEEYPGINPLGKKDMTKRIESIGINIEEMMSEVNEVCNRGEYHVGGHLVCTKHNVIPNFMESGRLFLDRDHLEGLAKILLVSRGKIRDY